MTIWAIIIPCAAGSLFLLIWAAISWRYYGPYEATGPLISGLLCALVTILVSLNA